MTVEASQREKTGIPKNPGRADLGMKATLLFPSREIVEQYYVPLIYTACRTCYSELAPEEIFRRATAGEIDVAFNLAGPGKNKNYNLVLAGKVKDGNNLGKTVRTLVEDLLKVIPPAEAGKIKLVHDEHVGMGF